MTRITNNHALMALVRQQLSKVSRAKSSGIAKISSHGASKKSNGISSIRRLSKTDDFSDEELARAVVQTLLADEFGDGLVNDAKFQQVVDRITRIITEDPQTKSLMEKSLQEMKADI